MQPLDQKPLPFISRPAATPQPRCGSGTPPRRWTDTIQDPIPLSARIDNPENPHTPSTGHRAQLLLPPPQTPGPRLNPGPTAPRRAPHPPTTGRPRAGGAPGNTRASRYIHTYLHISRHMEASFRLGMDIHRFF